MLSDRLTKVCARPSSTGRSSVDRRQRAGGRIATPLIVGAAALCQGCPLQLEPFDTVGDVVVPGPMAPSPTVPTAGPPPVVCADGQQVCGEDCIDLGAPCQCTSDADCRESLPNVARAQCVSGQCNIMACVASAYDCDGIAATGCEVALNDAAPEASEPLLAVTPKPASAQEWQASGPWYSLGRGCQDCIVPLGLPSFPPGVQGVGAADLADGDLNAAVRLAWNGGGLHLYFFHADDDLRLNPNVNATPLEAAAWTWDNFEITWDADPTQVNGASGRFLFVALDGSFVEYKGDNPVSEPELVLTSVERSERCTFMEVTLDAQFLSGKSGAGQGLVMQGGNSHGLAIAVNDFDRFTVAGEDLVQRQHQLFSQVPASPMGGYWFERPNPDFPMVQLSPEPNE